MSLRPCQPDDALLCAWRKGIAEAFKQSAHVAQQARWHEPDLLPEFTRHYQQLLASPRQVRRRLQRQWRKSLAGIALLLALGMQPALSATINVGGTCTLGRAITSANNDASRFCPRRSGADTIVLPANSTQTLTGVNNSVYGSTGLPVLRSVITIAGNYSTIRRGSNAPAFRVFAVNSTGNLTLRRTKVSGGLAAGEQHRYGGGLAVDAVTNVNTCPPPRRDQRGVRRPQDGNGDGGLACDIGSSNGVRRHRQAQRLPK